MKTKRTIARQMMAAMKDAYAEIDTTEPVGDDWNNVSQAVGRYDGLRQAYIILTDCTAQDVANEVVGWYITTDAYQASREKRS